MKCPSTRTDILSISKYLLSICYICQAWDTAAVNRIGKKNNLCPHSLCSNYVRVLGEVDGVNKKRTTKKDDMNYVGLWPMLRRHLKYMLGLAMGQLPGTVSQGR